MLVRLPLAASPTAPEGRPRGGGEVVDPGDAVLERRLIARARPVAGRYAVSRRRTRQLDGLALRRPQEAKLVAMVAALCKLFRDELSQRADHPDCPLGDAELGLLLGHIVDRGSNAWPALDVAADSFVRFLASKLAPDGTEPVESAVDQLLIEDL